MEKQITAVALVLSVAGLGYLKAQQMERLEAQAELDAAAAVLAAEAEEDAARVLFEIPHDRDAATSDIDIVLDGVASSDADSDSLTFTWVQTEGPDVELNEETPGMSSFRASPGKYTFELTVTDSYGQSNSQQAKVAVQPEPNTAPEVQVSVYAKGDSES